MKYQVLTSMMAFGFATLFGINTAAAQTRQQATIPFSFEAAGVEYSEGTYMVESMSSARVIKLTNVTNGHAAFVNAPILSGATNHGNPKLVFNSSPDGMKLAEVWFSGYPGMLTARPSKEVSAKVVVTLK